MNSYLIQAKGIIKHFNVSSEELNPSSFLFVYQFIQSISIRTAHNRELKIMPKKSRVRSHLD